MNNPDYKAHDLQDWPIDRLIEYARNPRKNDHAVDRVAAAIREFGFKVPVVARSDGTLVDGHLRLKAAKKLGMETVPVLLADDLTDAQVKAFRISVNRMAELAEWDDELLRVEFEELDAMGFDLELTGFDADEIGGFLTEPTEGLTDEDAVPEVQDEPVTVEGDVWLLGRHRLMCGDSTSADVVTRLMNNERADLLFTSPPYAQQRDYGKAKEKVSDWDALMQGVFSVAPVKEGAQVLVNLGLVHRDGEWMPYWDNWIQWMRQAGWRRFGWYVWDQGPGLPGDWNGRLAPSHEFIFHFNREARKANKTVESKHGGKKISGGGLRGKDGVVKEKTGAGRVSPTHRIPDSVFRVMRHKGGIGKSGKHPAVFPVALVEEAFTAYAKAGDVVFEPFCGSGTQVIAAEKTNIYCFASEIDPVYVDVAVKRWQDFTGQKAIHEESGRTFDEVSNGS